MSDEPIEPESAGLRGVLPRWGWTVVLTLFTLAAVALMIPDELATNNGISFPVFFWSVVAVQGIAAFGIIGVILYTVVD